MRAVKRRHSESGLIFVVSGPSGSGKTTLVAKVVATSGLQGKMVKSISLTTRPRRAGEEDKRDYFFVTVREFRRLLRLKKILEWTRYLGYYYATPREFVERQIRQGKHLILCLDLRGVRRLRRLYPKRVVTVFVSPPSLEELRSRISKRSNTTTHEEIKSRLRVARKELLTAREYDYLLLNEDLRQGVKGLKDIIWHSISGHRRQGSI